MAEANYLKMMTDLWETAGKTASGAQQGLMQAFSGRPGAMPPFSFAQFLSADTDAAKASETFGKLLNSFRAVPEAIAKAAGTAADPKTSELLQKIMSPQEWLSATGYTDQAVRQFVEGPKFADIGQMEQKFAALMKAWSDMRTRSIEQSTFQLNAYAKAAQEFAGTLGEAAKEKPIESRAQLVALWVETANKHMFEMNRSPEFLTNQRELLRASTAFKRAQTDLSDYYGELFGIPTRGEIDDLTKTVADLKRQFRADQRRRKRTESQRPAMHATAETLHGAN